MLEDTLTIQVEYSTEEDEGVYTASNDKIGLVTEGVTFSDLLRHLQDALAACFDDTDIAAEFNPVAQPTIKLI